MYSEPAACDTSCTMLTDSYMSIETLFLHIFNFFQDFFQGFQDLKLSEDDQALQAFIPICGWLMVIP